MGGDRLSDFAGLSRRAPVVSFCMFVFMLSLAGIPPLAGFFGKFLLLRAVFEQGAAFHAYYWLAGVALFGVVVSIYYYFGVVRAMFWSRDAVEFTSVRVPMGSRVALLVSMAGILFLGIFPNPLLKAAEDAVTPITPSTERAVHMVQK